MEEVTQIEEQQDVHFQFNSWKNAMELLGRGQEIAQL